MIRQRCAIYTRKSTEEGLDQSFNSLDAQREACAAYILSQRHEGWVELTDHYDDGGFSGGSMDRPGLQRLLEDVRARNVDVIVVYKVDRLTRALSDFAKMVEVFDEANVSFVSVTQAFNTTSSMGRLTLNVLLSFAQFEREVTAERIRDKIAGSKRKGMWMGGSVPMGYDARDKALFINESEAAAIRTIYREYVALGSVPALRGRLHELGIVSKQRLDRDGRKSGGEAFSRGALYYLLRNPIYIGKIRHGHEVFDGQHEAIVDLATWEATQALLDAKGGGAIRAQRKNARRWLDGILFDCQGRPMKTTYALKAVGVHGGTAKKRYWYYTSKSLGAGSGGKPERLPAEMIETTIRGAMARALNNRTWLAESLSELEASADDVGCILERASGLVSQLGATDDTIAGEMLAPLMKRVDQERCQLTATIQLSVLLDARNTQRTYDVELKIPISLIQHGRARPIVVRTDIGEPYRDAELIALVADARRWMAELISGAAVSAEEITKREGLRKGAVSRILPLAWLAPDIATAILRGHQPSTLSVKFLRNLPELPLDWNEQRKLLGFHNI